MFFGGYVITVLRRSARRRQEQAAGRSPEQIQLRNETQRFMATFPTFQYNGTRLPKTQGADSSGQPDDDEDDEGPMCSICLGRARLLPPPPPPIARLETVLSRSRLPPQRPASRPGRRHVQGV